MSQSRNLFLLTVMFLFMTQAARAQYRDYAYQRELEGISQEWHSIPLPEAIFKRLQPDLADLRIVGVAEGGDTLEAPYVLRRYDKAYVQKETSFDILNQSSSAAGYHYTFRLPEGKVVNQLQLQLEQDNFDWQASLEGSHDQQQWQTITEGQRILGIKNRLTDYRFTTLRFPKTNYRYLRLTIRANEAPRQLSATITELDTLAGRYKQYGPAQVVLLQKKKEKQTQLELQLPQAVPVSGIKLAVQDKVDYYRPLTIQYLADSFKTPKGWQYQYQTLSRHTLSSLEKKEFEFPVTITQKLRLIIDNYDSPPLEISGHEVWGPEYALAARFSEPAAYFLLYGKADARPAVYDVEWFKDRVPHAPEAVALGAEEKRPYATAASTRPLFENRLWLWAAMGAIMLLLGWFTLSMFKKG